MSLALKSGSRVVTLTLHMGNFTHKEQEVGIDYKTSKPIPMTYFLSQGFTSEWFFNGATKEEEQVFRLYSLTWNISLCLQHFTLSSLIDSATTVDLASLMSQSLSGSPNQINNPLIHSNLISFVLLMNSSYTQIIIEELNKSQWFPHIKSIGKQNYQRLLAEELQEHIICWDQTRWKSYHSLRPLVPSESQGRHFWIDGHFMQGYNVLSNT